MILMPIGRMGAGERGRLPRADSVASALEGVRILHQTTEAEEENQKERERDCDQREERASQLEKEGVTRRRARARARFTLGHALLGTLALLAAVRAAVQALVFLSALSIDDFLLQEPWDGSAAAMVRGTIFVPIIIPMIVTIEMAQLDLLFGGRPVGALRPEAPLALGHGGRVAVTLTGRVYVLEPVAFRALADALIHQHSLELELQSQVTVRVHMPHVPLLGPLIDSLLTVSWVHLNKVVPVLGARDLNVVFKRFILADGPIPPGCSQRITSPSSAPLHNTGAGKIDLVPASGAEAHKQDTLPSTWCAAQPPLDVELEVSVSNPSSFQFEPLGSLELMILDEDSVLFASCRTSSSVQLLRGESSIALSGQITVAAGAQERFSIALQSYLAGSPTLLLARFTSVSNRLYNGALAGLTVPAVLPGLRNAQLFESVGLILDPAWNVLQLAMGSRLNDGARLRVHNPLNVTVEVLGLSATVRYGGAHIASVIVPVLDPPVVMRPLWSGTPDRVFPVELSAPVQTLESLLGQLAVGSVEVQLQANITLHVGNTTNTVGYVQDGVTVFLGR